MDGYRQETANEEIYWVKASFGIWGCKTHDDEIRFAQSRAKESRRNAP